MTLSSVLSVTINGFNSPEKEITISSALKAFKASIKYFPEQDISSGSPWKEITEIFSYEWPLLPLHVISTLLESIESLTMFLPSALINDDLSKALINSFFF